MKNNASLVYSVFLVIGDALALSAAFAGAYLIRADLYNLPVAHPIHAVTYMGMFASLLPLWILLFSLLGLYNLNIYERRFSEVGRLLVGSFIGMLFVIFWNYLSINPVLPSKLVPIYGFVLAFLFLVLLRNLIRFIRTKLYSYGVGLNNVLIIGNNSVTKELVHSLHDSRRSGYRVG